jgi:hypothetical protein
MSAPVQTSPKPAKQPIPPLRQGDHLSAEEFMRRYEAMPEVKKAELIQGVVHMPSPVTLEEHGGPHFDLGGWLGYYRAFTPGTQGGDNTTIRLGPKNVPQPDLLLRILPECGGQSRTVDRYVVHAPELVAEVAASSVSFDLYEKLETYRNAGVREYIVWRVEDKEIDWFILQSGQFEKQPVPAAGRYESRGFPGLWLDPTALIRGDMKRVFEVLQEGIAKPEHLAFVEKLRAAAGGGR